MRNQCNDVTIEQFSDMLNVQNDTEAMLQDEQRMQFFVEYAWQLYADGDHRAAAFLCKAAKKKIWREFIEGEYLSESRAVLNEALESDKPKMRKNTARLVGALGNTSDALQLARALEKEDMHIAIPSMILALGAIGGDVAHDALLRYNIIPANDAAGEKHEIEEREALSTALSAFSHAEKHKFLHFGSLTTQLICAKPMAEYVAHDCERNDVCVKSYADTTVDISESDKDKIYKVRSFRELLIPVSKRMDKAKLRNKLLAILDSTHAKSSEPFRFRIEYRGNGDRRRIIDEYVRIISCERLVNSISDYEVEVRIYGDESVKLKLFTYNDNRFSYRTHALPASIHPANAASVMSYCRKYFVEDASVLDICCGSGTMLFERYKYMHCKRIMGVDIADKAIEAAKANAKATFPKALFYRSDCTRFTLRDKADEIISNLPFGNRVGNHENNEKLYEAIICNLKDWLKENGIAILYTMEAKLVISLIEKYSCYELLDVKATEAGGLFPSICIIRYRP